MCWTQSRSSGGIVGEEECEALTFGMSQSTAGGLRGWGYGGGGYTHSISSGSSWAAEGKASGSVTQALMCEQEVSMSKP